MKLTDEDRVALAAVMEWPLADREISSCEVGIRIGMERAAKICEVDLVNRRDDPLANSFDGGLRHCAAAIRAAMGGRHGVSLHHAVMLPTPVATDAFGSGSRNTPNSEAHPGISLTDWVRGDGGKGRMWPTPQSFDATDIKRSVEAMARAKKVGGCANLREAVHGEPTAQAPAGSLNPDWVEWLMGFPIGWTSLETHPGYPHVSPTVLADFAPSATPSSPSKPTR